MNAFISTLSPKVKASAWTGLLLTVLVTALTGITPDMLAGLGPWAAVAAVAITALAQAVAGYQKTDPARATGLEVEALTAAPPPEPQIAPGAVEVPAAAEVRPIFPDEGDTPGRHEAL